MKLRNTPIDVAAFVVGLAALAAVLSIGGPALDELDARHDAARHEAKARRLAAALDDLCGPNAVALQVATGEFRCFAKLDMPLLTAGLERQP